MEGFSLAIRAVSSFVWGPGMVALLAGAGLWFTVRLGFLPFARAGTVFRYTVGSLFGAGNRSQGKKISPFQAVSTALAGTMGTGNITGVATAIVAGGPGAIFWMWISAFLGMSLKYAEVLLAVEYRRAGKNGEYYGGPMYYLRDGAGRPGLAVLFALCCIGASFGIGNMSQSNSMAQAIGGAFSIPPLAIGIAAALLVAGVIAGGIGRIATVAERAVPLASLVYLGVSAAVLYRNMDQLPGAFALIFQEAWGGRAMAGGLWGYGVCRAMRYGMARGVFSNEAGLGSAPIAHGAANAQSPAAQGCWGIFEVFVDTILCCTLTTLVILTAGQGTLWQNGPDGAPLAVTAFVSALGSWGGAFVAVSMAFFALSSMISWYFYGERCLIFLSGERKNTFLWYKVLFILLIVIGSVAKLALVWDLSDLFNGLMTLPNLIGLLLLSPVVVKATQKGFRKVKRNNI